MSEDPLCVEIRDHLRQTLSSIHDNPLFREVRGPSERMEMDKLLKDHIFRYLFFLISKKGESLTLLFPKGKDRQNDMGSFPKTYDEALSVNIEEMTQPFYTIDDSRTSNIHQHLGRNCGRKFQVGEPIYRCHECGYDDTCVLCIYCFNAADHQSHHVYTDICSEFNTGICDCGDEEAWHTELHCKAEEEAQNDESREDDSDLKEVFLQQQSQDILEVVLIEVFDHFIDLFNQNIEPLPTLQKDITLKLREMVQQGKVEERAIFLEALAYKNDYTEKNDRIIRSVEEGSQDVVDLKDYTVIIYNDEYHNYSQATTALRQGVPDNKHTDLLTSKIDGEGRALLKCSEEISAVIGGFFAVQTNGLSATLTSWSEYIHQETCKYCILWLNHCLNIPIPAFQSAFRSAMGKVLLSKYDRAAESVDMTPVVREYFSSKFNESDPYRFADLSILSEANGIPLGHHKELAKNDLDHISNTLNETVSPTSRQYANSRLQYIFYFDNRYWKRLRKDLQNVIIPTLASDIHYKPLFCRQVVEIFNHITRSVAFMDREPLLNVLRECVVQLFTCPKDANMIFSMGSFKDILWSVIDIFAEFSKVEGGLLIWQKVQKTNPTKSYSISFKQGLYAVETLLSKVSDGNIVLIPENFISILTLCKLFNGAYKIKRKEGEHVLHEDQHFIPYLEYTTSVYSIIQTMAKVLENSKEPIDEPLLLNSIELLTSFLGHRSLTYKLIHDSQEIIKFEVHRQRVAFMNPVHTLYSFLIEKCKLTSALGATSYCSDFLTISDFALRSVVLCAQIFVGFWVRNGMSVLHQSKYYKNNPELSSYARDIHLNQLAFLREDDDIPRVIYNLLDRWALLDWFSGEAEFEHTIYEDKIIPIVQQFIAFVYQVLTERYFFKTFSFAKERRMYHIKSAVIYNLYTKPLSYSKLLRSMPDYLTEDTTELDTALKEVSTFVEPKGLADSGVFKLKQTLYAVVDPLKLLNMENEFESSAATIKTHLSSKKTGTYDDIIQPQIISPQDLDPKSIELGQFTRTDIFAKLVYKLLQVCIDKEEGTFLYELLHLVHGIFKDKELIDGERSIPQAYISKPICSQLMTIANSKHNAFSEEIKKKAQYLLEIMMTIRPEEVTDSLITSFGEQYVADYKAKKMSNNANHAESEKMQRKRMIKKRQEKLMAKFNNQQSKFMKGSEAQLWDQSKTGNDDDVVMDGVETQTLEEFTCALCQDNTSTDLFVVPAYHDHTPIFRPGSIFNVDEFASKWGTFSNNPDKLTYNDDKSLENFRDNGSRGSKKVLVSCNHSVHHSCFKRYVQKKRFSSNAFICPLCQTYSNCVLPIRRTSKQNTGLSVDSLVNVRVSVDELSRLFESFSAADFKNVYSTFNLVTLHSHSYDKAARSTPGFESKDTAFILAVHWANTISMLEVASRLDKSPNVTLLESREQKFKTLKNTLICIVLMCYGIGKPNPEFDPYVNKDGIIWNQNQLFQYIVKKCLFSREPLRETVGQALANFSKQLIVDFIKGLSNLDIGKMYEKAENRGGIYKIQSDDLLSTLKGVCFLGVSDSELCRKAYDLAYTCLLKNLLPTLRRCVIMIRVFHDTLKDQEDDEIVVNGINILEKSSLDLPDYVDQVMAALSDFESLQQLLARGIPCMKPSDDPYLKDIPYENCGIVKLVNLATYLNTYVTNSKKIKLREEHSLHVQNVSNRLDFKICLTCGVKVHLRPDRHEMSKHLQKYCFKTFGAFLIPNTSEVCLYMSQPPSTVYISAPYLNSHGEAGRNAMKRGDMTVLNLKRYEFLNSLWINNEIPGYISRVMGDEFRVNILSNGYFLTFNRDPRPRRAPLAGSDDEEDVDGQDDEDAELYSGHSSDDEERDVEMADDRLGDMEEGAFFGNGVDAGNVRGLLQVFENFQNTVENGINPEDAQFATPLLQFFPPQFGGINLRRNIIPDADEDDEVLEAVDDTADHQYDTNSPSE